MEYKLYDSNKQENNIIKQVLYNRGINDVDTYLNLNERYNIGYENLDNIEKACDVFIRHFDKQDCIGIIPDSDVDGYCSSAELYLYIKRMNTNYPIKIIYHNRAKTHGLCDVFIPDEVKLLIIADAGTNDVIECEMLKNRGIDIIILDHHEQEKDNPYAVIVNNQCSKKYSNKQLCGAGIVYKFLKALDDYYWNDFADDYLDLVALANISDVMDIRQCETKYLIDKGLHNIKNKFFKQLIQSQSFVMKDKITIHNIQWSITPIINAMIRIGSNEDKELLFKAFIEQEEQIFEYKKRATKNTPSVIIEENIYEHVARLCTNIKSKQDRMKDKAVNEIIDSCNIENDDKVMLIDGTYIVDSGLTGVIAMKIADMFQKPCILVKKYFDEELDKFVLSGSARNMPHSPIQNLKDVINNTHEFIFAQGHANAFGVSLDVDNKDKAISILNKELSGIEYDHVYYIDYILNQNDDIFSTVVELSKMDGYIGQGIDEPMIAVENIILNKDDFSVFGKNEDTISFVINDVKFIQFKCNSNNKLYEFIQDAWNDNDVVVFTVVGKPTINKYNGVSTPQIIIEDVNMINYIPTEDSNNDIYSEEDDDLDEW